MLTEFKGPSNHHEIFQFLVGETITAAFLNDQGRVVIVCASGSAIELGSRGENAGAPIYWKINADDLKKMVDKRRGEIERKLAELRDLPGITLP